MKDKILYCLIILFLTNGQLFAQESPFVSEKLAVYLNNEISGDRAHEYIRWQSLYQKAHNNIYSGNAVHHGLGMLQFRRR